ncbi:hypothetical protein [Spiroplasma endosymbiont of Aspidapion aeneum]|uniref:hypothetical protein n=1 Tax=Spiroplasma endosymbiont of Aspidapion aeneum TaxID=3066276 RepID=UPI00313B3CC4
MDINLKEFDSEQRRIIECWIEKKLDERLIRFLANKNFSAKKMWAMLTAIQNKISSANIRILANSRFDSTNIYKTIDAINDKIIDENFLTTYDFSLPFNIQFAIYKKNGVLSDEWKEFIIALFPTDINLCELDFLISFIDENMDLNLIKKYIRKPKDINYFVNLFSIVKSNLKDDEFLKLILRENPNYNKTVVIIDLKEFVDNQIIKTKLLKLNVKQLQIILELSQEEKSPIILDYLYNYKCKISNINEIELVKEVLDNTNSVKNIKDEMLTTIFDKNVSPQKILYISQIMLKFKQLPIVKFAKIFNFSSYEEYEELVKKVQGHKLVFDNIIKYFKSTFKKEDALKQIENIVNKVSEDKLLDYVENVKSKTS